MNEHEPAVSACLAQAVRVLLSTCPGGARASASLIAALPATPPPDSPPPSADGGERWRDVLWALGGNREASDPVVGAVTACLAWPSVRRDAIALILNYAARPPLPSDGGSAAAAGRAATGGSDALTAALVSLVELIDQDGRDLDRLLAGAAGKRGAAGFRRARLPGGEGGRGGGGGGGGGPAGLGRVLATLELVERLGPWWACAPVVKAKPGPSLAAAVEAAEEASRELVGAALHAALAACSRAGERRVASMGQAQTLLTHRALGALIAFHSAGAWARPALPTRYGHSDGGEGDSGCDEAVAQGGGDIMVHVAALAGKHGAGAWQASESDLAGGGGSARSPAAVDEAVAAGLDVPVCVQAVGGSEGVRGSDAVWGLDAAEAGAMIDLLLLALSDPSLSSGSLRGGGGGGGEAARHGGGELQALACRSLCLFAGRSLANLQPHRRLHIQVAPLGNDHRSPTVRFLAPGRHSQRLALQRLALPAR